MTSSTAPSSSWSSAPVDAGEPAALRLLRVNRRRRSAKTPAAR